MPLEDSFDRIVGLVGSHAVAFDEFVGDIGDFDHDNGARDGAESNHPVDILDQSDSDPVKEDQGHLVVGVDGGAAPVVEIR